MNRIWSYNWSNTWVDYTCATYAYGLPPGNVSNMTYTYPSFWSPGYPDHMLQPGSTCCIDKGDPAILDLNSSRSDMGFTGGASIWFDRDYDGMPDIWETYYGLNPNNPADGGIDGSDGDGLINREEYSHWLDPTAPDYP